MAVLSLTAPAGATGPGDHSQGAEHAQSGDHSQGADHRSATAAANLIENGVPNAGTDCPAFEVSFAEARTDVWQSFAGCYEAQSADYFTNVDDAQFAIRYDFIAPSPKGPGLARWVMFYGGCFGGLCEPNPTARFYVDSTDTLPPSTGWISTVGGSPPTIEHN
ncbi:MAG: hypothetical protein KDB35_23810 [Acidimicrobiales bacterium]|nr:hypothetical protein [Acidimicrobiales bacterium]